ncbi:unnamed protein product [Moneuplotes crassus]|uniref:Uncharacterized protein n=1 Tax=Euplotes crassus TaxID=5936 RepID=A0AAD1XTV5_EUPCR|nr:unnamed protein product [Moneuplotes crassus]
MEKINYNLKWKFKVGEAYNECALRQETEKIYMNTLYTVSEEYYYIGFGQKSPDHISMFLNDSRDQQTLQKMTKLTPQVEELEYIAFSFIQKNGKKLNRLLSQLRVNKLKRLYFTSDYSGTVCFSSYAKAIARLLPLAPDLVQINSFKVSHKDFGRVLVSCRSSPRVLFQKCRIVINGFDYLDNVQPSIGHISLHKNTITQPEEDNEYLDGLIQKIAESSLNGSLRLVSVTTQKPIRRDNAILPKKEYTIGNFDVRIC